MTEEEKRYWDEALFKINSKMEDILNRLSISEEDSFNTKSFLLKDSLNLSFRLRDLDDRITKLEKK